MRGQLGRRGSGLAGEGVFVAHWMSEKTTVCWDQSWSIVPGQAGSNLRSGPGNRLGGGACKGVGKVHAVN